MAIQLTPSTVPQLVSTTNNDIIYAFRYFNTTFPNKTADTLYVEIYTVPTKNLLLSGSSKAGSSYLTRLVVDTDANGVVTFLVNDALNTLFADYITPSNELLQRNTANYAGYFVKYGYVSFTQNNQMQYRKLGETDVMWALRAVLQDSQYLPVVDYANAVGYLTHLPDSVEVHRTENTYLSFLLPKVANETGMGVAVKGDFYFADGSTVMGKTISTYQTNHGGVYLLNVKPALLLPGDALGTLTEYDVWCEYGAVDATATVLDYPETSYSATQSYTASCPTGSIGSPVTSTVTAYSTISATDAAVQAQAIAQENALAGLTCNLTYTGTQTVSVSCQSGYYGDNVATATATSYISQADANAQASAAARTAALAGLVCTVITTTYTSTKSYTASCAAGYYGAAVTKTVTVTGYVSQADTDSKALAKATADANAALVCTVTQPTYTSTQYYTANCGNGYNGSPVTRSGYAESTVSQADADAQALQIASQAANRDITCTPNSGGTVLV